MARDDGAATGWAVSIEAPATGTGDIDPGLPRVLASKYRLTRRLGEGGMGIVFGGDHLELKTRVAIKLLQPKLAEDPSARARFLREARLAASIEGDHSARIFDVGSDGGQPFMVMEFLTGEPLDARLARDRRLDAAEASTIVMQLLDALAEAHAKGLVHRDVKPANLFLVQKPGEAVWVKVLDFGISKVIDAVDVGGTTSVTLTEPRTLLGSPQYMSPEQLRDSANVDARSDLWACGVVLFELLTGEMPFEGPSLADLCAQIVSRAPRPVASFGADVPTGLVRVIERCLEKDPHERPQSAHELATLLAPFANESSRSIVPRVRAWSRADGLAPQAPRRPYVLAGGVALVALSGALAFAVASLRGADSNAPPSSSRGADAAEPLDPIVGPTAVAPAPSAPSAAPGPSTSGKPVDVPAPSSGAAPRPRDPKETVKKRRIQDLDGIELIH